MNKTIKITLITLISVVALIIIAAVVAVNVIDPNDYKPEISKAVYQQTGRQLTIDGKMGWSLFPSVGLTLRNITFSNAAGFPATPMAQLQEADLSVKVVPLLFGRVEINTISLKGLQLNLMKNANGVTNWQDLMQANKTPATTQTAPAATSTSKDKPMAIAIRNVDIKNAGINWTDATSKNQLAIKNLNFNGENIAVGHPFTLQFDTQVQQGAKQYTISSNTTINIASDMNSASLDKLTIKLDDSTMTGNLSVTNFNNPAIQFKLNVDQLNVDKYLPQQTNQTKSTTPAANSAASNAPTKPLDLTPLRMLNLQGNLQVGKLTVMKLNITHASVTVNAKNGLITLNPVTANLYQGSEKSNLVLDARTNTPAITFVGNLANVQIQPLLTDFMQNDKISGTGNVDVNIRTVGATPDAVKRNLNGNLKFALTKGVMRGIDVNYQIKRAQALLRKQAQPTQSSSEQTEFGSITGSAQITNGIAVNHDLQITNPVFTSSGDGTLNLVNQTIDYTLKIQTAQGDFSNYQLPITISGSMNSPSIGLDMQSILTQVANQQLMQQQEKAKQQATNYLQNQGKKILGGLFK